MYWTVNNPIESWSRFCPPVPTNNPARNPKERKTRFVRKLVNVFKIAAWVVPGSANRAAFEELLNPLFKSMEETEVAWNKVPAFSRVSLLFLSPSEDFANFEDAKDVKNVGIRASNGPSSVQDIVVGTVAFGVRCRLQDRITGVHEAKPSTLLAAKVICESNLRYIFGIQKERNPPTTPGQEGDGRDP